MDHDSFIHPDELWYSVGLRADQTVVHLGCGAGFYLIPAAKIVGPNGKVIGFDILPDMLAETESRARREQVEDIVKTHRVNLEEPKATELPDGETDWVLVANVLHQSSPKAILAEAVRVVSDKGRVLIIEWDTNASPFGPPNASRRSKDEVVQFAKEAGLKIEKEFRPSPYHYGILLSKHSA